MGTSVEWLAFCWYVTVVNGEGLSALMCQHMSSLLRVAIAHIISHDQAFFTRETREAATLAGWSCRILDAGGLGS